MPLFVKQSTRNLLTHVGVGMGAASFWRGAWYVLDDHLFPDNAEQSAAASLTLGVAGMMASQGLMHKCEELARQKFASPLAVKAARFGALYTVAMSCVLVWRGTWIGWDCLYERLHPHNNPQIISAGLWGGHSSDNAAAARIVTATDRGHATHSGVLSHVTAVTLLLATGLFASVLAPPAAVSVLRDWAVRTQQASGSGTTIPYQGPAQVLAQRLFGGGSSGTAAAATPSKGGASSAASAASAAASSSWSAPSSSAASRALSSASSARRATTTVYPVSAAAARRQW